jgi:hypothetical protein
VPSGSRFCPEKAYLRETKAKNTLSAAYLKETARTLFVQQNNR